MIKDYASYFVSFFLKEYTNTKNIRRIVLFGSVAREEENEDSDIDIFIELKKYGKAEKEKIEKIVENFYKSREATLFKSKGVDNKINVILGDLKNWDKIRKSIESEGIVLYGPFISTEVSGKKYSLISWDKINKNRGAFLNKIYGFKVKDKRYPGILEKIGGIKIGKSSILIPIDKREEILKILKKYEVNSTIRDVYYEES